MDERQAAAHSLLRLARPYLDRHDRDGLAEQLRVHWSAECLKLLLAERDFDVVEVAAACLGLVGDAHVAPDLARLLHHDEPAVVDAAEDALWSIWFRDGGAPAQMVLYRIARSIGQGETDHVIELLTELIRSHPTYAEAHHQRGQARFMENQYQSALRDARRALDLNPLHFGAMALCGHCYAATGRYQEALKTYREVLKLHPNMPGIRSAIQQIRRRLSPAEQQPVRV